MSQAQRTQELRKKIRRRKPRKPGTLQDAVAIQWQAIQCAWEEMLIAQEIGNTGGVLSAVHALNQAAGAYAKLKESSDLEARIDALEEAMGKQNDAPLRKVA